MIFFPLLILGIILYFTDKRVLSVLIFFFFTCAGFQLFPASLFDTGSIISKPLDFSVLYVAGIFLIGFLKYPDFLIKNKLTLWIFIFLVSLGIIIYVSKFKLGVDWTGIIRTSRYFTLVLVIFIFRRLTVNEMKKIIKILFLLTFFLCTLYVIQSLIGIPLLAGETKRGSIGKITRYYNIPILYFFFLYVALFSNPFTNKFLKITSILIFILVCIVSLHRSLMIVVFLLAFLGIFLQGGFKGVIRYVFIGGLIIVPFMEKLTERFADKTNKDIESVMQGAFIDYGEDLSVDGTFLFRIAHFYERFEYVQETPLRLAFGVGLMPEKSPLTERMFDFKVGLTGDDREVNQLESADIAWSNFILRLGLVGTVLYLAIYFVMTKYFFRNRKIELALTTFLYILLLFLISLTSSLLYDTSYMVPALLIVSLIWKYQEEQVTISS